MATDSTNRNLKGKILDTDTSGNSVYCEFNVSESQNLYIGDYPHKLKEEINKER